MSKSKMKLRPTEVRYTLDDKDEYYSFDVVCSHKTDIYGDDCGWNAVVQLKSCGATSAKEALKCLENAAKALLKSIKECK